MCRPEIAILTGANGFVGSHLTFALVQRGIHVIGVTRTARKPFNHCLFPRHTYIQVTADIRNKAALHRIFQKYRPTYCFHLAAKSTVEEGQENPFETYDSNITGAINIFELSRSYGLKRIIVASTAHVYGDNPHLPYKENYSLQPSRPYETSKTCVDLIAQSYAYTYDMAIDVPRFVNLYGPGDVHFMRIIPKLMKQIVIEGKIDMWCANTVRDYLYIDDAIDAYMQLFGRRYSRNSAIMNFGTGTVISIRQLVKMMIKISGKKMTVSMAQPSSRTLEIHRQYVSVYRAQRILHWQQKTSLEEGLAKTFAWYTQFFAQNTA